MIKNWLEAFRLRTIPLSISGICMGSFLAFDEGYLNYSLLIFALITTILFQILSNLANDLGDSLKGTDNENRVGPARSVQAGKISAKQMRNAVIITAFLSLISAGNLIFFAQKDMSTEMVYSYVLLAAFCIIAAITYTVGKKAYGYYGLGDSMVFLFFGIVGVMGSNTLFTKYIDWLIILPSISIGCLSTAVLNLNNMRDVVNDAASQKNTLVVKIGLKNAKKYHISLLFISLLSLVIFSILNQKYWILLGCLPLIPLVKHIKFVLSNEIPSAFDPELKKVAITTFFVSIMTGIGLLIDSRFI
jgi:1,4-dihydroxy-2-naphthoate octaprenyltransferase